MSFIASNISGTFCASSMLTPSGNAFKKSPGFDFASSLKFLSSKEIYFLFGNAYLVSVDFPLCLGPVTATTGNCSASLMSAANAFLSIIKRVLQSFLGYSILYI